MERDSQFDGIPEKLGISKEKATEIFYQHWPKIEVGKAGEDEFFSHLLKVAENKISLEELKRLYYSCIRKRGTFGIV